MSSRPSFKPTSILHLFFWSFDIDSAISDSYFSLALYLFYVFSVFSYSFYYSTFSLGSPVAAYFCGCDACCYVGFSCCACFCFRLISSYYLSDTSVLFLLSSLVMSSFYIGFYSSFYSLLLLFPVFVYAALGTLLGVAPSAISSSASAVF
jgi:hypothetical protein